MTMYQESESSKEVLVKKPQWYRECMSFFFGELERFRCEFQNEKLYHAIRGLLIIALDRAIIFTQTPLLVREDDQERFVVVNGFSHLVPECLATGDDGGNSSGCSPSSSCNSRQDLTESVRRVGGGGLSWVEEENGIGEVKQTSLEEIQEWLQEKQLEETSSPRMSNGQLSGQSPTLGSDQAMKSKKPTFSRIQCPLCEKTFAQRNGLLYHIAKHETSATPIRCVDCDVTFPHQLMLQEHEDRHHLIQRDGGVGCPFCDKIFFRQHGLTVHISNHQSSAQVQCRDCQETFSDRTTLQVHSEEVHHETPKPGKCPFCNQEFPNRSGLMKHLGKHEKSEELLCAKMLVCMSDMPAKGIKREHCCLFCGKLFPKNSQLQLHVAQEHEVSSSNVVMDRKPTAQGFSCGKAVCKAEDTIDLTIGEHRPTDSSITSTSSSVAEFCRCSLCGKICRNSTHLKNHTYFHRDRASVVCEFCGKTCRGKKRGLKRHMMLYHQPPGDFRCDQCVKSYRAQYLLNVHRKRIHEREKVLIPSLVCAICGKSVNKYHMKSHLRDHEVVPGGFSCDVCPKTFNLEKFLKDHKKRHYQVADKQCQTCGKNFKTLKGLRKHELLHTGNLPFKCEYCDKSFAVRGELNLHLRIHANDRRYRCTECPKAFFNKGPLDDHMNTHTGRRPYVCPHCGVSFAYHGALFTHKKLKHRNATLKPDSSVVSN